MTHADEFHAGLVFLPSHQPDLDGFCRIVAGTLADYGHIVERQSMMSCDQARITTRSYAVKLSLSPAHDGHTALMAPGASPSIQVEPQGARLEITLLPADPQGSEITQSQLILLVMIYRMIEARGARHVEWLDPSIVLPAGHFMSAFSRVRPRRIRGRHEILDVSDPQNDAAVTSGTYDPSPQGDIPGKILCDTETPGDLPPERALTLAFRADAQADGADGGDEADDDIRRLTAWCMTGVIATISGPVGLSMAAVNLLRGEDFRLNTQVLALTTFFGFATTGSALADVLALLPL